jgi:hypothetical protein
LKYNYFWEVQARNRPPAGSTNALVLHDEVPGKYNTSVVLPGVLLPLYQGLVVCLQCNALLEPHRPVGSFVDQNKTKGPKHKKFFFSFQSALTPRAPRARA